jgi:hypothetical protein
MRRQFAAWIAVLGLVASACTSSADAEDDLSTISARAPVSEAEAGVERLVVNFFRALQERNAPALYALFTPDDQCRPGQIADLIANVTVGIAETSEVEVDDLEMRTEGAGTSISFTLIESQGASEKELIYEEFFPVVESGLRWRFDADLCGWLAAPLGEGDAEVQDDLATALIALEAFRAEYGSYQASGNDLRYYASGLSATVDELALAPGMVLVVPGEQQAMLIGQGTGGTWYCIAISDGEKAYGSGSTFEEVMMWDTCLASASPEPW